MFGEELDLAALDAEAVLLEVDAGLVGSEHVEAEEQVDVAALRFVGALVCV